MPGPKLLIWPFILILSISFLTKKNSNRVFLTFNHTNRFYFSRTVMFSVTSYVSYLYGLGYRLSVLCCSQLFCLTNTTALIYQSVVSNSVIYYFIGLIFFLFWRSCDLNSTWVNINKFIDSKHLNGQDFCGRGVNFRW